MKFGTFCQEYVVLQDRFHCIHLHWKMSAHSDTSIVKMYYYIVAGYVETPFLEGIL